MTAPIEEAYRHCVEVTRSRARNFYFGIRLLPPHRRRALCAVYAFARRIDDIGDGPLTPAEKQRAMAQARAALTTAAGHGPGVPDPVLAALRDSCGRFPIPLDAFADLIDGVDMDLRGATYDTFDDLVVYCRRVAGSIGRLCLGVFDVRDRDAAVPLADDLGVALQLTNILRDVTEDLYLGRVYLPAEDVARFGLDAKLQGPHDRFAELVRFEAGRAGQWFDRGRTLLPLLDRTSAACVGTMAGIYEALLTRIERDPQSVREGRVALARWHKTVLALRGLAGRPA